MSERRHNTNPDLPFLEQRRGWYVVFWLVPLGLNTLRGFINFSGHAWGSGGNNVVQEQCVPESFSLRVKQSW